MTQRLGNDFVERTLGDGLTVIYDDDVVALRFGFVQVMRCEN